jgi:hypothetical protein
MNKIEQELLNKIGNTCEHDAYCAAKQCEGGCIVDKETSQNCYSLLEKHCMGFANFIETNEQYLHYWKSKYTTEQLFNFYIEQL